MSSQRRHPKIHIVGEGVIYANPLPQLRSRKAYFPNLAMLEDGSWLAAFALGEAMESADQTTALCQSRDEGKSWQAAGFLIAKEDRGHFSDSAKLTRVKNHQVAALGYRFDRSDPEKPIGNPATGGLLPDQVFFCVSQDDGGHWSAPQVINTTFMGPVEASAPITVLSGGAWVSPIANFPRWDGDVQEGLHGRLLRSDDAGETWTDEAVTMRFPGKHTAIWEQRLCEYLPGLLVVIAWLEDLKTGQGLNNHIALSPDGGRHFHPPMDTGIHGQAASVAPLGCGLVLSLHAMRRQVEEIGILATVTDLSNGTWETQTQSMIWRPRAFAPNSAIPGVFSAVRFGQPSALHLTDNRYIVVFWCEEDGEASVRYITLDILM